MSDLRDLDLVPLPEREAAEVEGGRPALSRTITGSIPTPVVAVPPTWPTDGSAWMI